MMNSRAAVSTFGEPSFTVTCPTSAPSSEHDVGVACPAHADAGCTEPALPACRIGGEVQRGGRAECQHLVDSLPVNWCPAVEHVDAEHVSDGPGVRADSHVSKSTRPPSRCDHLSQSSGGEDAGGRPVLRCNPIPRLALGDVGSAAGDHLDQALPGEHPDGRRGRLVPSARPAALRASAGRHQLLISGAPRSAMAGRCSRRTIPGAVRAGHHPARQRRHDRTMRALRPRFPAPDRRHADRSRRRRTPLPWRRAATRRGHRSRPGCWCGAG